MASFLIGVLLALAAGPASSSTDDALSRQMQGDVVLRALVDELERSRAGLLLPDLASPYFIEYALLDGCNAGARAALGALVASHGNRSRSFRSDVRVGSYELDNANFGGGGGYYSGDFFGGSASLPIEDDYTAIRQALWWATDRDYKQVVEALVRKKAFMDSKLIQDKPPDFSHEEPAVYLEDRVDLALDEQRLRETATELSAVFRAYPDVRNSGVSITASLANRYLVNTEGARIRTPVRHLLVSATATVQAEEGMLLTDARSFEAFDWSGLPPMAEMVRECREMADQLLVLRKAPKLDSYSGPVLYDAEPAAGIFAGLFAPRFAGGQPPVGSGTRPDDFSRKLEKRILPRTVNVLDDPTLTTVGDQPVFGHYVYDDQGVKARPVQLVEQGKLKALLMSRNPSREFGSSNGHGRGFFNPRSSFSNLLVSSTEAMDAAALKQELIDAFQDEGLEFGLRVASLGAGGGQRGAGLLQIYRVFPDGREELARGAEVSELGLKAFKRILAAGDTPHVRNFAGGGEGGRTVVVPALLFEELDIGKIDRDFDKPPILPSPLAREEKP